MARKDGLLRSHMKRKHVNPPSNASNSLLNQIDVSVGRVSMAARAGSVKADVQVKGFPDTVGAAEVLSTRTRPHNSTATSFSLQPLPMTMVHLPTLG